MTTKTLGFEHVANGGASEDGFHVAFVTSDDVQGYNVVTDFDGWVARQQYQSEDWEYNPAAPSDVVALAKECFIG